MASTSITQSRSAYSATMPAGGAVPANNNTHGAVAYETQSGTMRTTASASSMGGHGGMQTTSYQTTTTSHSNGGHGGMSMTAHGSAHGHSSGHGSSMVVSGGHGSGGHGHGEGRIVSTVRGEERFTGETNIVATRTGEGRFTGETHVIDQRMGQARATGETRVIGHETGAQRQISVTEIAMGEEVIGETTNKLGRARRGKKVIREEVIEKVIVVPETIQIEEWVEDEYDMEETIVEVAKMYQTVVTVEVPEIEIIEKIVEQIETVIKEKIIEVPKIETVEKIVEIPVIQTIEKIIEVPEIQYNDVPVERIVEVPDMRNEEVIREVKKANFVDKSIDQIKLVANASSAHRKLPVPVEAETVVEFTVAAIQANYVKKKFPVYLPRFIEVPVSRQFVDAGIAHQNDALNARIANLTSSRGVSLCEIEKLATEYQEFATETKVCSKQAAEVLNKDDKEAMFRNQNINLEQYALYKNLPIEIGDIHWGKYNAPTHGQVTTYSSAEFGMTAGQSSSAQIGMTARQTSSAQFGMTARQTSTQIGMTARQTSSTHTCNFGFQHVI